MHGSRGVRFFYSFFIEGVFFEHTKKFFCSFSTIKKTGIKYRQYYNDKSKKTKQEEKVNHTNASTL